MMLITVSEEGGASNRYEFQKPEVTIGRLAGNDIVLSKGNVSKAHSRIVAKDCKFVVVDMRSTNGTFVNGKKIAGPQVVRPSDEIHIGDYILNVDELAGARATRDLPPDSEVSVNGVESEEEAFYEEAVPEDG